MELIRRPSRAVAVGEGILANLIWASSFVFVKMGMAYMGPLSVGGLRYLGGFLLLLPFVMRDRASIRRLPSGEWFRLFLIGLSAYTLGNGAFYVSLKYLSATTMTFLMSQFPLFVLLAGVLWLKEIPTRWQILGTLMALIGTGLFFASGLQAGTTLGLAIATAGLVAFLIFGILGREAARDNQVGTLPLTAVPLAIGGGLLLLIAVVVEGPLRAPASGWIIVLWLAVVNTALAYLLYNHALQVLTALEMNVMLSLGPLGAAVMAWFLLGERLDPLQLVGMVTAIVGVVLVQWKGQSRDATSPIRRAT